jgi:ribosome-binding factor A
MSSIYDSSRKRDFKARRLCRQVSEALQAGLSGECADEVLQQVWICSVDPAGEASRLIVTASVPEVVNPAEALTRLERARGLLRTIVATAIHRRKVPDLSFRIAGPEATAL